MNTVTTAAYISATVHIFSTITILDVNINHSVFQGLYHTNKQNTDIIIRFAQEKKKKEECTVSLLQNCTTKIGTRGFGIQEDILNFELTLRVRAKIFIFEI